MYIDACIKQEKLLHAVKALQKMKTELAQQEVSVRPSKPIKALIHRNVGPALHPCNYELDQSSIQAN